MILIIFLLQLQPFVDACLSKKNVTEAERYAERAPIEGKWKLYLKLGLVCVCVCVCVCCVCVWSVRGCGCGCVCMHIIYSLLC